MCTIGNTVNNITIILYGADGNYNSCGDHFVTYKNIESLCCTPETNIIL